MNIYEFRDELYCYVVVVVAESVEEAVKLVKEKTYGNMPQDITEHEIKKGLVIEGGGNG